MPQRLTVINIKGDADQILQAKREFVDPVMQDKARQYGGIWSVTARTDDGIMIVNLWPDEESSERAAADSSVQATLGAAGDAMTAPSERAHYEVVDYFTP